MSQLLVRDIESSVVKKLRSSAAAQGVSVEEAHRRLLRSALLGNQPRPQGGLITYLRNIPPGDTVEFPRFKDLPRSSGL